MYLSHKISDDKKCIISGEYRDGQIFVNPSFDSVDYASASAPDNLLTDNFLFITTGLIKTIKSFNDLNFENNLLPLLLYLLQ